MKYKKIFYQSLTLSLILLLFSLRTLLAEEISCSHRFADVTERAMPSVVNITVWKEIQIQDKKVYKRISEGSGVIVSPNGYIVTNHHVLNGGNQFRITLHDGREFTNIPIGPKNAAYLSDRHTDIALLKIGLKNGEKISSLPLGDSKKLRVGEWVIAIGNPFGLRYTVTAGIVSAKGRVNVGFTDYEDFIQTDAAINPGNSGGALVNLDGELVAINTAIKTNSGGYQGVSFAIPVNMVKKISKLLLEYGKVIRGWMGFYIQNRPLSQSFYRDQVEVVSVLPHSPASRAGMQAKDIITHYNGQSIRSFFHLRNLIATAEVGKKVNLRVNRSGQIIRLEVIVGKRPESERSRRLRFKAVSLLGIEVQDIAGSRGVKILYLQKDSAAQKSGLQNGDIILEIEQEPIATLENYYAAIEKILPGNKLRILVQRKGKLFLHYLFVPEPR